MKIGQRLLELRKSKQLSQEEVADKLNVTRQTISKWETDQSTPDFDKISPLCKLYGITADELINGTKNENNNDKNNTNEIIVDNQLIRRKRAKGISIGVLLYFIAVVFIIVAIPVFYINPILSTAIFLIICGIATFIIVYTCIFYKKEKIEEEHTSKLQKQINEVIAMIVLIIYLIISFATMAWHITWILWIVYALIEEIVKLIFILRGNKDEK